MSQSLPDSPIVEQLSALVSRHADLTVAYADRVEAVEVERGQSRDFQGVIDDLYQEAQRVYEGHHGDEA